MDKLKKFAAAAAVMGVAAAGGIGIANMDSVDTTTGVEQQSSIEEQVENEKDYTVLLYVIGSDLESDTNDETGAASKDMQEIATAMKTNLLDEKVNVVAEIGGTEKWSDQHLSDTQNGRIIIDSDGISVREDLKDVNMGQSTTLTEFIDYGIKYYPAKHYILIFWDHGTGPVEGYGYDTQHNGDSLTLEELHKAMQNIQQPVNSDMSEDSTQENHKQFDLIGFDACNMGNIETVNIFSEYADYVVASPATEAVDGWDYSWMSVLAEDEPEEKDIGKSIVDSYDEFYGDNKTTATLSCYDMSEYDELYEILQSYNAQTLDNAQFDYTKLNKVRKKIFGYFSGGQANDYLELLDVKQLYTYLTKIQNDGITEADKEWLNKINKALNQFVAYTTVDTNDLCGISIYLPGGDNTAAAGGEDDEDVAGSVSVAGGAQIGEDVAKYMKCLYDKSYLNFVLNYAKVLDEDLELEMEIYNLDINSEQITFEVNDELFDTMSTAYVVTAFPMEDEENLYYLLSTDSDVQQEGNVLSATLDAEYFSIADQLLCLMEVTNSNGDSDDNEDYTTYLSPILYNGELCMMSIEVSLSSPDGVICGITPYTSEPSKEVYTLSEGDSFAALYPILTQDGEISFATTVTSDTYYQGEEVVLEEYDCTLGLMNVDFEDCVYELMIDGENLKRYYSGF
jgi:hypothetical protein